MRPDGTAGFAGGGSRCVSDASRDPSFALASGANVAGCNSRLSEAPPSAVGGVRAPRRIYFTGGATALIFGWRESSVDADLKLDPEPAGIFEAIAQLKEELEMNVELASPDQFIPPVPGWRERSTYIARYGEVDFYHYDLVSQGLAKLARGHDRDFDDVRAMLDRELVTAEQLLESLEQIEGDLLRYPAIDAAAFAQRVRSFVERSRA